MHCRLMTRLAIALGMMLTACEDADARDEPSAQECEPGSMRCIDERQRQVCGSDGTWATAPSCFSQVCAEGECDGSCAPGSHSCLALERAAMKSVCTLPRENG